MLRWFRPKSNNPMNGSIGLKFFFDKDDVLCHFADHAHALFGMRYPVGPISDEDFFAFRKEFYGHINGMGSRFWHTLPVNAPMVDLAQSLTAVADVFVLTAIPCHYEFGTPEAAAVISGKHFWNNDHLGFQLENFHITKSALKYKYCTGPDCVLIDDRKSNINDWIEAGGTGILHKNNEETFLAVSKILLSQFRKEKNDLS